MVKLRLKRFGKKGRPYYRIVATQARTKREGKSLDEIGFYDPIKKEININKEKTEKWLAIGAQPTYTVLRLLIKQGVVKEDKKLKKVFKDKPGKKATDRKKEVEEKKESVTAVKEESKVEEKKEEVKKEEKEVKSEEKVEEKKEDIKKEEK